MQVGVSPVWGGGAGVKLKSLMLLGCGIPTVMTAAAAQGLPVRDGVHCRLAEEPREITADVERLLADRPAAATLGAAGREVVEAGFTWELIAPPLPRARSTAGDPHLSCDASARASYVGTR